MLFGIKSTVIKSETAEHITCNSCKSKGTVAINIIGNYKHLLQIPFLSGGKQGASVCEKCGQTHYLESMPDAIKLAYYELKETVRTPIWHYSGLIFIKTLVLIKIFSKYV